MKDRDALEALAHYASRYVDLKPEMDDLLYSTCEDLEQTFGIDDAFERDWSKDEDISPTFAKAFGG